MRFAGAAMAFQAEIIGIGAILLLDKPDLTWEDEYADRLHDQLRYHFEIGERYKALETKLVTIRDILQALLTMGSERRMFFVEVAVLVLIVIEVVTGFVQVHSDVAMTDRTEPTEGSSTAASSSSSIRWLQRLRQTRWSRFARRLRLLRSLTAEDIRNPYDFPDLDDSPTGTSRGRASSPGIQSVRFAIRGSVERTCAGWRSEPRRRGRRAARPQAPSSEPFFRPFSKLNVARSRKIAEKKAEGDRSRPRRRSIHAAPEQRACRARQEQGRRRHADPAQALPPTSIRTSFTVYMAGVRALPGGPGHRIPATASQIERAARTPAEGDPDEGARTRMRSLVTEGIRFETVDDGERLEGRRLDVDPRELRRLRRAQYAVDGKLDLHGLGADEARHALDAFIKKRPQEGDRVVLVVHGKGLALADAGTRCCGARSQRG